VRKVTFGGACSLDGYFARPDGGLDWLMWSDEAMKLTGDYWPKVDCVLMGRKTFEVALANAGAQGSDAMETYVFSRTLPAGKHSSGATVVAEDAGRFVAGLKERDGKEICVMGGGDLATTLFEAGVIDEVGLNVHPVLLGRGIPAFFECGRQTNLELMKCQQMKNGCVYLHYRVVR
jgi:dihydrofolate reductase